MKLLILSYPRIKRITLISGRILEMISERSFRDLISLNKAFNHNLKGDPKRDKSRKIEWQLEVLSRVLNF